MDRNGLARPSESGRPLSRRAVIAGGVLVGLAGAVAVGVLLYFYGSGTEADRTGLDVVRMAGTLVVGTGGVVALLLVARRQRYTELTLEHQREVPSPQSGTPSKIAITVRSGICNNSRTVAAVWRASCSRLSGTPARSSSRFHSV
ncbi:MAG: hypothetical protein ACRDTA_04775 [Pseudonocardiaceae bacterium]